MNETMDITLKAALEALANSLSRYLYRSIYYVDRLIDQGQLHIINVNHLK